MDDIGDMGQMAIDYFSNLFGDADDGRAITINYLKPVVTFDQNTLLIEPFTIEEFRRATFQMHLDKAPSPDGLSPAFYQKFWNTLGADVFQACL